MLLPEAVEKLGMQGTPDELPLRTIRQDVQTVCWYLSPFHLPQGQTPDSGSWVLSLQYPSDLLATLIR